eukprot:scaffold462_cov195-Pinguiococcus_pyrenoidosus.AAC.63
MPGDMRRGEAMAAGQTLPRLPGCVRWQRQTIPEATGHLRTARRRDHALRDHCRLGVREVLLIRHGHRRRASGRLQAAQLLRLRRLWRLRRVHFPRQPRRVFAGVSVVGHHNAQGHLGPRRAGPNGLVQADFRGDLGAAAERDALPRIRHVAPRMLRSRDAPGNLHGDGLELIEAVAQAEERREAVVFSGWTGGRERGRVGRVFRTSLHQENASQAPQALRLEWQGHFDGVSVRGEDLDHVQALQDHHAGRRRGKLKALAHRPGANGAPLDAAVDDTYLLVFRNLSLQQHCGIGGVRDARHDRLQRDTHADWEFPGEKGCVNVAEEGKKLVSRRRRGKSRRNTQKKRQTQAKEVRIFSQNFARETRPAVLETLVRPRHVRLTAVKGRLCPRGEGPRSAAPFLRSLCLFLAVCLRLDHGQVKWNSGCAPERVVALDAVCVVHSGDFDGVVDAALDAEAHGGDRAALPASDADHFDAELADLPHHAHLGPLERPMGPDAAAAPQLAGAVRGESDAGPRD